jgi:CBS domain-containing protein
MTQPPTIHEFMAPVPATIEPDKTLEQARKIMSNFEIRHLPVVNRAGHLVGILSERDIALVESLGKRGHAHTVEEAMTPQVFTCGPDAHLHAVAT